MVKKSALLGRAQAVLVIPARLTPFVVGEGFAKYRGTDFNRFLGRVEEPNDEEKLVVFQPLLRSSKALAIIEALGGSMKARTFLADIDAAKEAGKLEKDRWYLAFIEDICRTSEDELYAYTNERGEKRVLRTIRLGWMVHGWDVNIYSIADPGGWGEWAKGCVVLSRDFPVV